MIFNSTEFMIFFPIVVLTYYWVPKKVRKYWLLAASYYFYMCWNVKYVMLLVFSTVVTYLCGMALEIVCNSYSGGNKACVVKKRVVLFTCVLLNLGILFYFKYFNFFFRLY